MTSVLATIDPLFEKNQTLTRSIYSTFRRESRTKQDSSNNLVSEDKSQTATFDGNNRFTVGPTGSASPNLTLTTDGNLRVDKITPNAISLGGTTVDNITNNIATRSTPATTLPTSQAVIDYVSDNVPTVANETYALVSKDSIPLQPKLYIHRSNNMLYEMTLEDNLKRPMLNALVEENPGHDPKCTIVSDETRTDKIQFYGSELTGVSQTTGTSTTSVMSQDAVTKQLKALPTPPTVVQSTGTSTTNVMSQDAVSTELDTLSSSIFRHFNDVTAVVVKLPSSASINGIAANGGIYPISGANVTFTNMHSPGKHLLAFTLEIMFTVSAAIGQDKISNTRLLLRSPSSSSGIYTIPMATPTLIELNGSSRGNVYYYYFEGIIITRNVDFTMDLWMLNLGSTDLTITLLEMVSQHKSVADIVI